MSKTGSARAERRGTAACRSTAWLRGFWDSLAQPTRPCDGCKSFPLCSRCDCSGMQPALAINGDDYGSWCGESHTAKQKQRCRCAPRDLCPATVRAVQTPAMSDISHPSAIHGRPDQLLCDVRNLRSVLVIQSQPLTLSTKTTKIAAPGSPHGLLVHAERRRLRWAISRSQIPICKPSSKCAC